MVELYKPEPSRKSKPQSLNLQVHICQAWNLEGQCLATMMLAHDIPSVPGLGFRTCHPPRNSLILRAAYGHVMSIVQTVTEWSQMDIKNANKHTHPTPQSLKPVTLNPIAYGPNLATTYIHPLHDLHLLCFEHPRSCQKSSIPCNQQPRRITISRGSTTKTLLSSL